MSHFNLSLLITITVGLILMLLTNNHPFAVTLAVLAILITIMMTIQKILNLNRPNSKRHSKN